MEINTLKTHELNQNGYHKNILTKERIGALFIYPIDFTPDDCLACDGYSLLIADYEDLHEVIGTKFNQENDEEGTFRIPDYNITGRFLQPYSTAGTIFEAGLPNITGTFIPRGDSGAYPYSSYSTVSGAFTKSTTTTSSPPYENAGSTTTAKVSLFNFSAKNSSSVYGNSSTVQPPSQGVHVCIRYK